jgi:hypothetical protein
MRACALREGISFSIDSTGSNIAVSFSKLEWLVTANVGWRVSEASRGIACEHFVPGIKKCRATMQARAADIA